MNNPEAHIQENHGVTYLTNENEEQLNLRLAGMCSGEWTIERKRSLIPRRWHAYRIVFTLESDIALLLRPENRK